MSTPMPGVMESPAVNGSKMPSSAQIPDVLPYFQASKLFRRESHGKPTTILSLDFDDSGEFLMSSESDESIQIYNVKEGKHSKTLLSKKYGVKLAKFSHNSTSVFFASTKVDDTIRYLSTHDNSFIRYFRGHEGPVTCLAPNPGEDTFLSCSTDNTVRLWDINSENCAGKLNLALPFLAAFDPSASVIAIASEAAQTILLYDFRQYDKEPFATFDLLTCSSQVRKHGACKGWNKLEFSNDGKSLLVGTSGGGHFLLDAFDGTLKCWLARPNKNNGPARSAPGDQKTADLPLAESSGDAMFTPDGRYVISGQRGENVLVWDTMSSAKDLYLAPIHEFERKSEAAVMAYNPRYNVFASADKEVLLWLPDQHAMSS